jgi:dihydroorotate dehydrogenase (fumarate)
MNKPLSTTTGAAYKNLIKPLLFIQKPDVVHARMIKTVRLVQGSKSIQSLVHASLAYSDEDYLSQKIIGINFTNPVGLSAGFDKNFELLPIMKAIGFGFMEGGSLTFKECDGNPKPWFYRLPKTKSLVVYAGLANRGVNAITKSLKRYPKNTFTNFPLNVSVAMTNSPESRDEEQAIADYAGSLRKLNKENLGSIYTLNISCPNTYGGEPFTTPERLEHLLSAVEQLKIDRPIFIKMPSNLAWPEFKQLVKVADRHNVTGLTISNLAKDRSKANLKDNLPDSVKGNLSGMPTQKLSDNLIKQTYQAFKGRFVIVGVGGIFSAKDAYRKIQYGANLVELITGLVFEGPQLIGQINHDLVELLKKDGYSNIAQAVGSRV